MFRVELPLNSASCPSTLPLREKSPAVLGMGRGGPASGVRNNTRSAPCRLPVGARASMVFDSCDAPSWRWRRALTGQVCQFGNYQFIIWNQNAGLAIRLSRGSTFTRNYLKKIALVSSFDLPASASWRLATPMESSAAQASEG